MTATVTAPRVIASHNVQALAQAEWFAFTGNEHFAYLTAKPLVYAVQIKETIHGEFYVSTCYAPGVAQVHAHDPQYRSNPFATLAEAKADANRVWLYYRDEYVMGFGAQGRASEYPRVNYPHSDKPRCASGTSFGRDPLMADGTEAYETRQTLCPECQHFGTLTTTMEAYGNSTTCSTPDCTYSSYYSIGD